MPFLLLESAVHLYRKENMGTWNQNLEFSIHGNSSKIKRDKTGEIWVYSSHL